MNENEQIQEMAKVLEFVCELQDKDICIADCDECRAKALYSKGYRKVERGEWRIWGMFNDFVKCTVCGDTHPMQTGRSFNFCHNCGADMRGTEE